MALTDNEMVMPVAPAYGGGFGGNGFGGDWAWIILLLLLAGNGGWGNGFGNEGGIYPWMNQANITSNGFQNQLINDNITGIRDGVNALSTQLCGSTSDIQMALATGFAGVEQGANARQIANMQQAFAAQTAVTQGMNDIGMSLQNCCCENRANIADLKYTVATENCADRAALSDGIRDVIASQTASTQRILDQLCSDKIDAKNERIAELERQLTMANLAASQTAQTAQILADNARQTTALEQYLNPVPIPAYPVQNPNCCYNNCGCGCA